MPARTRPLYQIANALLSLVALAVSAERVAGQSPPMAHHPGQWTPAAAWPERTTPGDSVQAVHMALVRGDTLFARPHSRVLAWGNWGPGKTGGGLWRWNPTTGSPALASSNLTKILDAPTPPYDIFCAGHAALPDGDLLVVSGTERGKTGEKRSARFDVATGTWTSANMNSGRWYANATVLGRLDLPGGGAAYGRVLATAGNKYDHMVLFGGRRLNDGAVVNDVRRYAITGAGHWDGPLNDPTPGTPGSDWPEVTHSRRPDSWAVLPVWREGRERHAERRLAARA